MSKKRHRNSKAVEYGPSGYAIASNDESKVVTASRLAIRLQLWATREEDQVSKIQPEFSYCIWRNGNVVIVALRGHLGRVAATELAPELEKLLNDGVTSVLFDCHDLDFTGLHGYKIVLAVARGLQRRKGCFGVYNVDPRPEGSLRTGMYGESEHPYLRLPGRSSAPHMQVGALPDPRSTFVSGRPLDICLAWHRRAA